MAMVDDIFYGEYSHTLDVKGRIIVPSKIRESLGFEFIVTKGEDKCLVIYPKDEWNERAKKLKELPTSDKYVRRYIRSVFASATNCEVDKQGRIMIPQILREHAGLEKDVVIAGVLGRVEIWSRENWMDDEHDNVMSDPDMAEKMEAYGI